MQAHRTVGGGELELSVSAVATKLGVSIGTVRRWTEQGALSYHRTPGGQRRFSQASLDQLIIAGCSVEGPLAEHEPLMRERETPFLDEILAARAEVARLGKSEARLARAVKRLETEAGEHRERSREAVGPRQLPSDPSSVAQLLEDLAESLDPSDPGTRALGKVAHHFRRSAAHGSTGVIRAVAS